MRVYCTKAQKRAATVYYLSAYANFLYDSYLSKASVVSLIRVDAFFPYLEQIIEAIFNFLLYSINFMIKWYFIYLPFMTWRGKEYYYFLEYFGLW